MPIEQALEPEEKKLYERPEVLAIGAVVILGGIFLVTRQRGWSSGYWFFSLWSEGWNRAFR